MKIQTCETDTHACAAMNLSEWRAKGVLEFLAQNSWDQKYIFRAPTKPTALIFKKEPNAENRKAFINKKEPNAETPKRSTRRDMHDDWYANTDMRSRHTCMRHSESK